MIGGRVDNGSSGTFTGTINNTPIGGAPISGSINCQSDIRMNYGGFQLGQDIAKLNIGGGGATLHVGVTGGYAEANAQDRGGSGFTGNFQIPFVGIYAAYTNGRFFADAMVRGDFYQMSLSAADAALQNQRLNGLGGTFSTSAGYRFDLGNNWFFEPSGSFIYSKVNLDTLSLPGGYGNNNNPFFLPPATLAMSPNESILGRIGGRVGTTYNTLNVTWQPFATASVWHEFAGNNTATYTAPLFNLGTITPTPPATGTLSNTRVGTYGQYSIGVAASAIGSPLLGYVRIDYRNGSNIESLGFNAGLRYNFDPTTGLIKTPGIFKARPAAVAAYDWTGFYVGAFAGAGWGDNSWSFPRGGVGANSRTAGALAGINAGYNKQFGPWVLGVEGDIAATTAKGGKACIPNLFDINALDNGLATQNCNNDLKWLATATGKAGYAWDRVLVYGKAGAAWTDNKLDVSCNGDAFFPQGGCIPSNNPAGGIQNSITTVGQLGWTVGAGFELALTPSWSAKAEYNYTSFGSRTVVLPDTTLVSLKQDFNQLKIGVNYHFGKNEDVVVASAMPVKAKAAPVAAYNWTGIYAGAAVASRASVAGWDTLAITDGTGAFIPPDPTTASASLFSANAQGRLYGGYNWQASPKWVVGLEGDVGNGDSRMNRRGMPGTYGNGVNACDPGPGGVVCNQASAQGISAPGLEAEGHDSISAKSGWDGTIRGKLGMLVTPTILFYGTGGAAFQQVSVSAKCDGTVDSWCGFTGVAKNQSFTSVRTGWTVGLGIEAVVSGNWISKVEARYADFGRFNNTFFAGTGDDFRTSVRVQTFTALAGVSYKFGQNAVVAKY